MTNTVEIRVNERGPFAEGHHFGDAGAYERIVGRVHFAVDPEAAAQTGLVHLVKAPRNEQGLVSFAADLFKKGTHYLTAFFACTSTSKSGHILDVCPRLDQKR